MGTPCLLDADCNPPSSSQLTSISAFETPTGLNQPDLVCSFGVCILNDQSLVAGDPCSSNVQCSTEICADGECLGAALNFPCSLGDCGRGLECLSGACRVLSKDDDACTSGGDCASFSSECSETGVCRPAGRLSLGQVCYDDTACEPGLICAEIGGSGSTSVCATVDSLGQAGTLGIACNTTNDCNSTATCECNASGGTTTCTAFVDCKEYLINYYDCLNDNGCSRFSNPLQQDTCAFDCREHVQNYGICIGNDLNARLPQSCQVTREISSASALSWAFFE